MSKVIINGPEGRLEGRYHHSKIPNAPLAIVLHPSPERGGTMNNKITYYLYQLFVQRGFSTLRFNFRGVGNSQGLFDDGEGELGDAAYALDWMQELNKNAPYVWVGGFSFGSWVGMQLLMRRPEIKGFISISPPSNDRDFSFLAPCPTSGLIIHGSDDDLVPPSSVDSMMEKMQVQRGIKIDQRVVEGANHFFTNHTDTLMRHVHDHMNKHDGGVTVPAGLIDAA
jgi:hypothetical protein